jgi:hypothetical protein
MTTTNAYECVTCGKHTGLFLSICRECNPVPTTIPVSESQYLGTLEVLGAVWSGAAVPVLRGSSPVVSYVARLVGEERAA